MVATCIINKDVFLSLVYMKKADCTLGSGCILLKSIRILQGPVYWDYEYVWLWFWWFKNVQGTIFMGICDSYVGMDKVTWKFE